MKQKKIILCFVFFTFISQISFAREKETAKSILGCSEWTYAYSNGVIVSKTRTCTNIFGKKREETRLLVY